MHIGHCKALFFNHMFAKKHDGKMLLRFDDTNPLVSKREYVDSFIKDLETLQMDYHSVSFTSDYFDTLISYCETLIKSGDFYVDMNPDSVIKLERNNKTASRFRDTSIDVNLERWQNMINGADTTSVVRAKIDYANNNGCLRDPNMYRCIVSSNHYRTGNKYNVYPLYDFACPIIDSLEGVTHAFRSNEYHDRDPLYRLVQEKLGLIKVEINDFSRLNISYTLLSKRKLNWFITQGLVYGWNHPILPTIQGLFNRGLTLEGLKDFVSRQKNSKNTVMIDYNDLWAISRKYLEPSVPRFFAVNTKNCYTLYLTNHTVQGKTVYLYKKKPELGTKQILISDKLYVEYSDGKNIVSYQKVTLMNFGNIFIDSVNHDKLVITGHPIDDVDYTSTVKLHWVNSDTCKLGKLFEYHNLITVPKIGPSDKLEDVANYNLVDYEDVYIEDILCKLHKGDKLQLERKSFCIMSGSDSSGSDSSVALIKIPEGRKKCMDGIV